MPELVIRPRARRDLKGIWKYTLTHWGPAQADRYLEEIDREIRGLTEFPERGAPYESIRAGYRALHIRQHLVLYVRKEQRLEIVRVLHEAMDIRSRL